jgi:transcriptional regulator with XRE-family HTH domain
VSCLHLHKRLKKLRYSLELTQEEFSKVLELERPTYARIERGTQCMTASQVRRLCLILSIDANQLLGINHTINHQEINRALKTIYQSVNLIARELNHD